MLKTFEGRREDNVTTEAERVMQGPCKQQCYWTWAPLPDAQLSQSTDTGCGEGKYSIYCRASSKENRQLMIKRPKFLDGFQERVFKGNIWGEGCRGHDFLLIGWWWGDRVVFQKSSSSSTDSNQSGVSVLVLSMYSPSSTWVGRWGLSFSRTTQRCVSDCYVYLLRRS